MALEEDEVAVERRGEDIDAGLLRAGQQLIAACDQVARAQLVEARMRDLDRRGGRSFVSQSSASWRSRRRRSISASAAGARCRRDAAPRRGRQGTTRSSSACWSFAQSMISVSSRQKGSPAERCGDRLGAGDDQPVDMQPVELGDVGILPCRCALAPAWSVLTDGSEKQWKRTRMSPAAGLQQPHELTLGRLQRAVRHVVDEPDRELAIGRVAAAEFVSRAGAGASRDLTISRRLSNRSGHVRLSTGLFRRLRAWAARRPSPAPGRCPR